MGLLFSLLALPSPQPLPWQGSCQAGEELFAVDLDKVREDMNRLLQEAEVALEQNQINIARRKLTTFKNKLDQYKGKFSRQEKTAFNARIKGLQADIDTHVEALVAKNLAVLKRDGAKAAIEYRQRLTSESGLGDAELVDVDQAIVNDDSYGDATRAAVRRSVSPEETAESQQLGDAEQARREQIQQEQQRLEQEQAEQARVRARAEQQKLEAEQQKRDQKRLELAQKEAARRDRNQRQTEQSERQRQREENARATRETKQNKTETVQDQRRERDLRQAEEADKLLQREEQARLAREEKQKRADAAEEARLAREERRRAEKAYRDSVRIARAQAETEAETVERGPAVNEDSVLLAKVENLQRREDRDRYVAQARVNLQKIEQLLAAGKVDEANTTFGIYEANLRRYLEPAVFERIRNNVTERYATYASELGSTERVAGQLTALISQKKGDEAYTLFAANKSMLARHQSATEYGQTKREVTEAYTRFQQQHDKAVLARKRIEASLAAKNSEQAMAHFQQNNELLSQYLKENEYSDLESRVRAAFSTLQDKKQWAKLERREIEEMVASGQGGNARARFDKNKRELATYLPGGALTALERSVTQAYAGYLKRRSAAFATADQIRAMLAQYRVTAASELFKQNQERLQADLDDAAIYANLNRDVDAAVAELQQKKAWAGRYIGGIYVLIEQSQGVEAYARYQQGVDSLRKYSARTSLDSVAAAATRSRDEFLQNRAQARSTAAHIQQLLRGNQVQASYTQFQQAQPLLDHYLDDDSLYSRLSNQVSEAFRGYIDAKKRADQRLREIDGLVAKGEGLQARAALQSYRGEIEGYVEPTVLKLLETNVARAESEYRANQAKAGRDADEIRRQIGQGKTDEAYAQYRFQREALRRYLDEQIYTQFSNMVETSYRNLLAKRAEARTREREVTALIRREEGVAAAARFSQVTALLTEYLDPTALADLESSVRSAEAEYRAGEASAIQNRATIENLISQKKISDAYSLFDQNSDELKKYLSPEVYAALKKSVNDSYDALQAKTRQALQQVQTINREISQFRGNKAGELFAAYNAELRKYLAADAFENLQQQVKEAVADHARNRQRAVAIVKELATGSDVERCYLLFKAERSNLRLYLTTREYTSIENTVTRPYESLLKSRKQVQSHADEIHRNIKRELMVDASRMYYKNQARFQKYLDPAAYRRLDSAVTAGTEAMIMHENDAQTMADAVYNFVRAGNIELAIDALKRSRSILKRYLDVKDYVRLEKTVAGVKKKFDEQRGEARVMEKQIERNLSQDEVYQAYKHFRLNRASLKAYLPDDDFMALERRVNTAYVELRNKRK
jgi:hypothetical protein